MSEEPADGFADLLRRHRHAAQLTQEELAERSGVSVRSVGQIERGRHPRAATVVCLATALGLPEDQRGRFFDAARAERRPGAGPAPGAPCQLPAGVADFTGRAAEVDLIRAGLTGPAPGLLVVTGPPGMGKTTLAVHAAYGLRTEFPDGQLYVNLRGAGGNPVEPATVLDRFLRGLGVTGEQLPDDAEERGALYRTMLADRRVLVVLDDAGRETQVRPLLPGAGGSAVLVTSRRRLAGLEGARALPLDVLPAADAVDLLARIAGPARVAGQRAAAELVADRCGGLPLAVRVAGARLAARPSWPLRRLADMLADERRRLDELAAGDLGVRSSLALSYQSLTDPQRRAFRLLGTLEAGTFAGWLAAPLLDLPVPRAERLVEELAAVSLLDVARVGAGDRYRFHDVIRAYARERAEEEDGPAEISAAGERVLAGWLAVAEQADRRWVNSDDLVLRGTAPRWPLPGGLVDRLVAEPLRWFDAEWPNLVAAVEAAVAIGADETARELTGRLSHFLRLRTRQQLWLRLQQSALAACRAAGNRRGEAALLAMGGFILTTTRDRWWREEEQHADLVEAFAIYRELGDERGQAVVHQLLSEHRRTTWQRRGSRAALEESLHHAKAAVALSRTHGEELLEAAALSSAGAALRWLGRYPEAAAALAEACWLCRRLGADHTRAWALWNLGAVLRHTGRPAEAEALLVEGLGIVRQLEDRRGEAQLLLELARIRATEGDARNAERLFNDVATIGLAIDEPGVHARVQYLLGRLRLQQHRYAQAARHADVASECWRVAGAVGPRAGSLLLLAEIYTAAGRHDDAAAVRRDAHRLTPTQIPAPDPPRAVHSAPHRTV